MRIALLLLGVAAVAFLAWQAVRDPTADPVDVTPPAPREDAPRPPASSRPRGAGPGLSEPEAIARIGVYRPGEPLPRTPGEEELRVWHERPLPLTEDTPTISFPALWKLIEAYPRVYLRARTPEVLEALQDLEIQLGPERQLAALGHSFWEGFEVQVNPPFIWVRRPPDWGGDGVREGGGDAGWPPIAR